MPALAQAAGAGALPVRTPAAASRRPGQPMNWSSARARRVQGLRRGALPRRLDDGTARLAPRSRPAGEATHAGGPAGVRALPRRRACGLGCIAGGSRAGRVATTALCAARADARPPRRGGTAERSRDARRARPEPPHRRGRCSPRAAGGAARGLERRARGASGSPAPRGFAAPRTRCGERSRPGRRSGAAAPWSSASSSELGRRGAAASRVCDRRGRCGRSAWSRELPRCLLGVAALLGSRERALRARPAACGPRYAPTVRARRPRGGSIRRAVRAPLPELGRRRPRSTRAPGTRPRHRCSRRPRESSGCSGPKSFRRGTAPGEHVYTVAAQTDTAGLVYLSVGESRAPGGRARARRLPAFVGHRRPRRRQHSAQRARSRRRGAVTVASARCATTSRGPPASWRRISRPGACLCCRRWPLNSGCPAARLGADGRSVVAVIQAQDRAASVSRSRTNSTWSVSRGAGRSRQSRWTRSVEADGRDEDGE